MTSLNRFKALFDRGFRLGRGNSSRRVVLHFVWSYLFLTGGWIHNQIVHLERYRPVIVARIRENERLYPAVHLHLLPGIRHSSSLWARVCNVLIHVLRIDAAYLIFSAVVHRPHIVHVHFGNSGWENLFLRTLLRKRYVVSFYGYDYHSLLAQNPVWKTRYRSLFRQADAFITEGSYARQALISLGCPEVKVFENHLGVDVSAIPFVKRVFPGEGQPIKLLQVASFVEKKGQWYSVLALRAALDQVSTLELTFIGEGALQSAVRRLVDDLSLQERVRFLPAMPYAEVLKVAYGCHIFIHPSLRASDGNCEGGAPVVLLDMQATGMPVISTRHCDIPEYVIDGIGGFLADERDYRGLAERIVYLARHEEIWGQLGENGRNHVMKEFNAVLQAKKLEDIYDQIARRPARC